MFDAAASSFPLTDRVVAALPRCLPEDQARGAALESTTGGVKE